MRLFFESYIFIFWVYTFYAEEIANKSYPVSFVTYEDH